MTDSGRVVRPKLGAAFGSGAPDRAAGLGGLLPPPPPLAPTPVQVPAVEAEAPVAETKSARSPRPARTRATAGEGQVVSVIVYLTLDVLDQVRAAKRREGDPTYDELLVAALANVSEDQLRREFEPERPRSSGLIEARPRRPLPVERTQLQLRLTAGQRTQLDALARAVGAPSRSRLVEAAYKIGLTEA